MNMLIMSIRDVQTDSFGPTWNVNHHQEAARNFADQIQNKVPNADITLRNHPEDFELYQVGTFDTKTGLVTAEKIQVVAGSAFKNNTQG